MDRVIKFVVALFVVIAAASVAYLIFAAAPAPAAASSGANDSIVYYFYGQGCPHCAAVEPFMENMTTKYPDVDIRMLEVWYNQTNQQVYTQVNAQAGISPPGVPEVVIGKTVIIGQQDIPDKLEGYLQAIEKKK
ncbi:thioredoxin domain-containing protein [Methanoregula sp.]|uniref:thioredoxin domain-containing protein n=1 Tax=Methanoregula sp. TaxID=2052170 RepID=UPI003BB1D828